MVSERRRSGHRRRLWCLLSAARIHLLCDPQVELTVTLIEYRLDVMSMVRPSCVEALLGPPEQPSCSLWHVGAGRLTSVDHGHNV